MSEIKPLPAILSAPGLFALCLYGRCGDDGRVKFNFPAGPSGATGLTETTGPGNVYFLRIKGGNKR